MRVWGATVWDWLIDNALGVVLAVTTSATAILTWAYQAGQTAEKFRTMQADITKLDSSFREHMDADTQAFKALEGVIRSHIADEDIQLSKIMTGMATVKNEMRDVLETALDRAQAPILEALYGLAQRIDNHIDKH